MTKDEALKLALEALEEAWYHVGTFQPTEKAIDLYDEARTAIKEALAQTQEPVGQLLEDAFGRGQVMWFNKPKDESMLYTTPPQRTWVGLTDEDIWEAYMESPVELDCSTDELYALSRTVEAKLRIKNNG